MYKYVITIFWALNINFILLLGIFFIPIIREFFKGGIVFLIPFIIFSLLGLVLIFTVLKSKTKGKLKNYLLLTGVSAAGIFIAIILHNFIYGLFIYMFGEDFWGQPGDEGFFFIVAIFIFPLLFLIGSIKSFLIIIKTKKH